MTVVPQSHNIKSPQLRIRTLIENREEHIRKRVEGRVQDEETTGRDYGSDFDVLHGLQTKDAHYVREQLESFTT